MPSVAVMFLRRNTPSRWTPKTAGGQPRRQTDSVDQKLFLIPVPKSQCSTELHAVIHTATGRRAGCGELAPAASRLTVPKKEHCKTQFKSILSEILVPTAQHITLNT
jgi:hypothetical protein